MKPQSRPASPVRPSSPMRRLALAFAIVALAGGCHHKRTALRPVYVNPAPVVAPAEPCGTPGAEPCATSGAAPAFGDSTTLTSPPSVPAAPARPKTDDVVPQSGSEPRLYPNDKDPADSPPPLNTPSTRRPTNRRSAVLPARRNLGARERVAGFVDQPDDLFLPPKADRAWRYIVLHHSDHASGSYAQIDKDHRERLGTQGCGYHFVVGNGSESPDGRVAVASRWLDQKAGAHCRDATSPDANDYGIGICLIGDLDETPATARQVEATSALVAYLRDRYDIPADRVVSHAEVAQSATSCPGAKFSIDSVRGVRSQSAMR